MKGFRRCRPAVHAAALLPNPHFIPDSSSLTGRHPEVAKYIRSFPQTREFIHRISELLIYLIPHYIREGKSYLTIAFGCTGGKHRSVMIAEDVKKQSGQGRIQREGRASRFAGFGPARQVAALEPVSVRAPSDLHFVVTRVKSSRINS